MQTLQEKLQRLKECGEKLFNNLRLSNMHMEVVRLRKPLAAAEAKARDGPRLKPAGHDRRGQLAGPSLLITPALQPARLWVFCPCWAFL